MTLDKAIKRAEILAEEKKAQAWEAQLQEEYGKVKFCKECAEEHRQLAEWLKDYKRLLEQEPWIPVSERLPEPDVEVLVTDDAGGLATISTDSIYESEATAEKEWYTSQNVTAWMPLPKPYQQEVTE